MSDNITINHQITRAPAGSILVKHPENISKTRPYRKITVVHLHSGQPRAYADSYYEAEICIEGGSPSTVSGYDLPFGTGIGEEQVKNIARVLVRPFDDTPKHWASARLESIQCVKKEPTYAIWRVKVVEPFTD